MQPIIAVLVAVQLLGGQDTRVTRLNVPIDVEGSVRVAVDEGFVRCGMFGDPSTTAAANARVHGTDIDVLLPAEGARGTDVELRFQPREDILVKRAVAGAAHDGLGGVPPARGAGGG